MARVLTNKISLAYAIETSLGVLAGSPVFFLLEPNDVNQFGAEITTKARRPISRSRQRRKGSVVDLDSGVEFVEDLTRASFLDFVEAFCFAEAANANLRFRNAPATGTAYTVPSLSANQGGKLQFVTTGPKSLLYARGYAISGNNGLKPLTADAAAAGTSLTVAGNTIETPPTNAMVEIAGVRCATGDLAITVSGLTGTLTSGNNGVTGGDQLNFTTLGWVAGQELHIGGLTGAQQFSAGVGYVRIRTIAAAAVTFDKMVGTLATDPGTGDTVDLLYGSFVRNVQVDANADDNRYIERSFTFEATFPDLDSVGVPEYQYSKGCLANEMTLEMPLSDLATITFGFVGTDTPPPTPTRLAGATTVNPQGTTAFATASNILKLRLSASAEADTCFKSLSLKLGNGVTPEKCLGTLGATFMNVSIFTVDVESQNVFADSALLAAIRNNDTVTADAILKNADFAVAIDLPSLTLGGGDLELPADESVKVNWTGEAFEDSFFGTSIGVTQFPVVP